MKYNLLIISIVIIFLASCKQVNSNAEKALNEEINVISAPIKMDDEFSDDDTIAVPVLKSTLSIGNYIIKTKHTNDDYSEINDSAYFYNKKDKKRLFVFCKKQEWYDCNSVGYEWAKYEIKKDSVMIYSLYAHQGGGNGQPFGVRKKIYVVNNSEAKLVTNNMFLEERYTSGNKDYIDGVEYILNKPIADSQQQKLDIYVKRIEQDYGGKFLLFKNGEQLLKEVRSKFMPIIKAKINEWKKYEAPYNRFKI